MSGPDSQVLTILRTDIKDFTGKTVRSSRGDLVALLDKQKQIVLPLLEARGGRLINTIGEAFLMVFDSPTEAVLAGKAVQEALARYNAYRPKAERIEVRVAVNMGEVHLVDDDIFGEAVNVTAQLGDAAGPGDVYLTEAVYLAMNKAEVALIEVGPMKFKGTGPKVTVYRLGRALPALSALRRPGRAALLALGLLLLGFALLGRFVF